MNGAAALPFYGGTKCVNPPIKRTPVQNSARDARSRGGLQRHLRHRHERLRGRRAGWESADPALSVPGTVVNCQWWGRDAAGNTALSDGLEYAIGL